MERPKVECVSHLFATGSGLEMKILVIRGCLLDIEAIFLLKIVAKWEQNIKTDIKWEIMNWDARGWEPEEGMREIPETLLL